MIGLAETHLNPGDGVEANNYTWFGHCRTTRHRQAVAASGGVGFLISKQCLDSFDVSVLGSSYEDSIWLKMTCRLDPSKAYPIYVCYLPPEGSSSNVNANDFYDALLTKVNKYKYILEPSAFVEI